MRTTVVRSLDGSIVWIEQRPQRVAVALTRIGMGNFSKVKSLGAGVLECKVDYGPSYRIYFGRDADTLVIRLGGGTRKRQARDIRDRKSSLGRLQTTQAER